ncbi:MAG: ParB/RepB/Spo0J family partition protein [Candidatus Saccharimonadales bacterium]
MSVSNSKKRGLGRSFESLIPTDLLDESFDPTATQDHRVSDLRQIKLDQIITDPNQPRKDFNETNLQDLAESISEHGVLQPIIVIPKNGGYQIVAGERRFHASKLAGLTKIPALVRTLSDQHRLEVSLIENLQRQDLNVVETATAYLKLRDQFNLTLEQIGKKIGNSSVSAVSNRLRLLKLPKFVLDALIVAELTEGQARPLIGLDESIIKKVLPKIIKEDWSARRIEQFIVNLKKNSKSLDEKVKKDILNQPYKKQLKQLKAYLKTDVVISTTSRGSGRITIKFKNEEELERIQKLLS